MAKKGDQRQSLRQCSNPMRPASTLEQKRFSSPFHQSGMRSLYDASPTFTCELNALADWLAACRIWTVAMESTGVYWIPLYQLLEQRRIEVYLLNAHYLKCVPRPGRATPRTASGFKPDVPN